MFKVINLSGTHLSVDGNNLAPNGYINVEAVDSNIRYLENKRAVEIVRMPRMIAPSVVVAAYEMNTSKRKLDSGRTK